MLSFWPEGIEIKNTLTPVEIIDLASEEWLTGSGGLLRLELKGSAVFVVCGQKRSFIFDLVERQYHYPATIDIFASKIDADTPQEFSETLRQILMSGRVKAIVYCLLIQSALPAYSVCTD